MDFIQTSQQVDLSQQFSIYKLKKINKKYCEDLKIELKDAYKRLYETRTYIYNCTRRYMYNVLPVGIGNSFFIQQEKIEMRMWIERKQKINQKIGKLNQRKTIQVNSNIKPIDYYCGSRDHSYCGSRVQGQYI